MILGPKTHNYDSAKIVKNNLILIRSKKARKQIIQLKQDISKPDFGREEI